MILFSVFLLMAVLICAVGWAECYMTKHAQSSKVQDLKDEIQTLHEKLQAKSTEDVQETGAFIRTRSFKPATPETYRLVFDLDPTGQRVLEHLTQKFCRDAYVPDSRGGERETCKRLGNQEVINFILLQITKSNEPDYSEEQSNE